MDGGCGGFRIEGEVSRLLPFCNFFQLLFFSVCQPVIGALRLRVSLLFFFRVLGPVALPRQYLQCLSLSRFVAVGHSPQRKKVRRLQYTHEQSYSNMSVLVCRPVGSWSSIVGSLGVGEGLGKAYTPNSEDLFKPSDNEFPCRRVSLNFRAGAVTCKHAGYSVGQAYIRVSLG